MYGIMFLFSIYYYKERTILCDTATQLFEILNNHWFAIQVERFGAAITQVFPLLVSELGMSLKGILIAYSMSFIVFYASTFFIILWILKNEKMAMVLLMFNILMVRYSFFWIQCEFVQGVVFTLLFLTITETVLKNNNIPKWYYAVGILSAITIVYFYPLLIFVLAFILIYYIFLYPKKFKFLSTLLIIFILLFYIKNTFFSNWYDVTKFESTHGILERVTHFFQLVSFKQSFNFFKEEYYPAIILFVLLSFYLMVKKKYAQLTIMIVFLIGLYMLIVLTYPDGFVQFYIESQFLILSLFIAVPFAYDVLNQKYKMIIISLISILFIYRVMHIGQQFSNRLEYVRTMTAKIDSKRIIPIQNLDLNLLKYSWGIAYEVWLLSTLEDGKTKFIVCEEENNQFDEFLNDKRIFLSNTKNKKYQDININIKYFDKDTNDVYRIY